jgi:formimidoylglutamate deiminase
MASIHGRQARRSGRVHKLHVPVALIDGGWHRDVLIAIADRTITVVAANTPPPADAERLAGIAVPGLANVHSHAFQRAMAGLAEGPSAGCGFAGWRHTLYRFLRRLRPEDVEAIAAWVYLEMLEAGFTSVGEFHYLHHDRDGTPYAEPAEMAGRIVAAAAATGIGLTLLPAFYAHGGCGGAPPQPGQERFLADLDGFHRLMEASAAHAARLPGTILGIAPHSLRAVEARELAVLVARWADGPIHIHAAEQAGEVEECLLWSGARPVAWLLDAMPVDQRWCLVHATHMTSEECARLAASGAIAGLCPITEANLGDGIFDAVRFLADGGGIGVGSDSNIRISAAEELRTLEYAQRLRDCKRNRLSARGASTGRHLFDAARLGGARALARASGSIAPGQAADILILDPAHPALLGRCGDQLLDAWIFAGGDGIVSEVFAAGRRVVAGGRHVDRASLGARFAVCLARLASEM